MVKLFRGHQRFLWKNVVNIFFSRRVLTLWDDILNRNSFKAAVFGAGQRSSWITTGLGNSTEVFKFFKALLNLSQIQVLFDKMLETCSVDMYVYTNSTINLCALVEHFYFAQQNVLQYCQVNYSLWSHCENIGLFILFKSLNIE